jgi:ABC-type lipoprotein export system ATPase subunit
MTISFNNVTPAPLAGVIDLNTDIWLRQCNFKAGKKYKVIAPSGKGKSTFIHYIYGLRYDYTGEVKMEGKDVKTNTADEWASIRQQQLSIVYQDLRLFLQLTVSQNIQVKSVLYKNDPANKVDRMTEALGINNLLHKQCNTLSYGERQRVAIIRALIQPFDWLLLDEPFSHLDKENSLKAAALINEEVTLRKAGVIITSLGQDNYFDLDHELKL